MNRIDVAIVRFLPFVLYILIGVCTTLIICGKDIGEFYDNISEKAHDFNRGMKALNDFSDSQYI